MLHALSYIVTLHIPGDFPAHTPLGLSELPRKFPICWLAESREAAVAHAYTHEVMGPIEATLEEGGELPEVYFSESYLQQAGKLSQLRAAAAEKRLAAIWREGVN